MSGMVVTERFWAIDFDRCLGDTAALYELFIETVSLLGLVEAGNLQMIREQARASGGSSDIISYLFDRQLIARESFPSLARAFQERVRSQPGGVLEKGAREFLEYLVRTDQSFGIMTYGGEVWQRLKIAASGLGEMSCMIVSSPQKGQIIAQWYHQDKAGFAVPQELNSGRLWAREVVLIDDKATAFTDLPDQARGYWLQLSDLLLPSQRGDVPDRVAIVKSFGEIVGREQS
jgi:hypothetical protein